MKKNNRSISREKAVIGVYQHLLTQNDLETIYQYLQQEPELIKNEKNMIFSKELVMQTLENKDELVQRIETKLKKGWTFERLGYIERAILLVSSCELLKFDMAKTIVINEAVELCKEYCDDESYKFINGVLNSLV